MAMCCEIALPPELWLSILYYVEPNELLSLARECPMFSDLCSDRSLWERLCRIKYKGIWHDKNSTAGDVLVVKMTGDGDIVGYSFNRDGLSMQIQEMAKVGMASEIDTSEIPLCRLDNLLVGGQGSILGHTLTGTYSYSQQLHNASDLSTQLLVAVYSSADGDVIEAKQLTGYEDVPAGSLLFQVEKSAQGTDITDAHSLSELFENIDSVEVYSGLCKTTLEASDASNALVVIRDKANTSMLLVWRIETSDLVVFDRVDLFAQAE
eukprot:CFRG7388T1